MFHSQHVTENLIFSIRNLMYELHHELQSDFRLRSYVNEKYMAQSANSMGTQPIVQTDLKK